MKTFARLLLICTFVVLIYTPGYSKPELKIMEESYDFGIIPRNSTAVKKFWFKSIGDDTLRFTNIKTGCTCATMPLEQDFIAPGDSMQITFLWDVGRRVFRIGRYPYIFTNAKEDAYRMELTGEVHPTLDTLYPISIAPFKGELNRVKDKSVDEIDIKLTNQSNDDIEISIIYMDTTECQIDMPTKIAAQESVFAKIKVRKEFLDKEFRNSFTFKLDTFQKNIITIPFRRKFY